MIQHAIDVHVFGLDRERGSSTVTLEQVVMTRMMVTDSWGDVSAKQEQDGLLLEIRRLLTQSVYTEQEAIDFVARAAIILQTHRWTEGEFADVHAVIFEAAPARVGARIFRSHQMQDFETVLAHVRAHWQTPPISIAPRLTDPSKDPANG